MDNELNKRDSNGERVGLWNWIMHDKIVVSVYSNGHRNGKFKLFHKDGRPHIFAYFTFGSSEGERIKHEYWKPDYTSW